MYIQAKQTNRFTLKPKNEHPVTVLGFIKMCLGFFLFSTLFWVLVVKNVAIVLQASQTVCQHYETVQFICDTQPLLKYHYIYTALWEADGLFFNMLAIVVVSLIAFGIMITPYFIFKSPSGYQYDFDGDTQFLVLTYYKFSRKYSEKIPFTEIESVTIKKRASTQEENEDRKVQHAYSPHDIVIQFYDSDRIFKFDHVDQVEAKRTLDNIQYLLQLNANNDLPSIVDQTTPSDTITLKSSLDNTKVAYVIVLCSLMAAFFLMLSSFIAYDIHHRSLELCEETDIASVQEQCEQQVLFKYYHLWQKIPWNIDDKKVIEQMDKQQFVAVFMLVLVSLFLLSIAFFLICSRTDNHYLVDTKTKILSWHYTQFTAKHVENFNLSEIKAIEKIKLELTAKSQKGEASKKINIHGISIQLQCKKKPIVIYYPSKNSADKAETQLRQILQLA